MISKKNIPQPPDFIIGEVILINKQLRWTSFDIVNSLRIFLKYNYDHRKLKIGHAGTLDPLATGLVIVCTGRKTKVIDQYQAQQKTYTGSLMLGQTTPSFDLETEPDQTFDTQHITPEIIHEATQKFTGVISQRPPVFSAIKINGKRAYDYARANKPVKMTEREVEIFKFNITKIEMPEVWFEVQCSKGTYIRSLASDFGKALGSGAYLSSLCRTAIGDYRNEDALTVEEFKTIFGKNEAITV
ncbi:MAG TPA: tRNA pseudouridine(55) synthase TruB [Bacteroidales bacterium]|nr:tRNA pseudouridine(55) synthase TruB [Bacteroidales bacterium]